MTPAQKAFEEWCESKKIGKSSLAHEDYKSVWHAAWKCRGKLDVKICENKIIDYMIVDWTAEAGAAQDCAEAIRKVGV